MATDPAAKAIAVRYSTNASLVTFKVHQFIRSQWAALEGFGRQDINRFAVAVAPVVTAAQHSVAALSDRYVADLGTAALGRSVQPVGVPGELVEDEAIRGVATEDVYRRPALEIEEQLDKGRTIAVALALALIRARMAAATDLQLARTHAFRHIYSVQIEVVGYRRIITGVKTCRLCVTAAARTYRKSTLMPIHSACNCGTAPIFGDVDPLRDLNDELFAEAEEFTEPTEEALLAANERSIAAYRAAYDRSVEMGAKARPRERAQAVASRDRLADQIARRQAQIEDLRGDREPLTIAVHQHGELGPILYDAAHQFSTP